MGATEIAKRLKMGRASVYRFIREEAEATATAASDTAGQEIQAS